MQKIKKDDLIYVIKGKDRGKKGKVLAVFPKKGRAVVEGINLVKKHMRRVSAEIPGGIVSVEMPISIANLMLFCKHCNRPVRVGFKILENKTKVRFCKACKEII
ncbi:MAG: 50S ribosomal protein L24 [Candidatus Omnitrophica bacterium]|nr:50S ribosomal protein L24 [Candidatus Omnitrophota bacterium]